VLTLAFAPCTFAGVPAARPGSYVSPETLNSHVVFAPACSTVVFTSNREGPLRPFVVNMGNPARAQVTAVTLEESGDFIAQALAPDCRTIAMVSDLNGNGVFALYLYDLETRDLRNITGKAELEARPAFSPESRLIAYLSGGQLCLYDYSYSKHLELPASPDRFKSFIWSDSGASVFLEDERTDIWRYDLKTRKFTKIWTSPRFSYSNRMLSQRGEHLLFVSDHESDYSQIYQLDLKDGSLERLYPSQRDQYSPVELDPGHYVFRTSNDGSFIAAELRNGQYRELTSAPGVTFDFSLQFGAPLLMYSNDHLPQSLYWLKADRFTPLLPENFTPHQPSAVPIENAQGMTNFLYLPSHAPRAWLIWFHGGPHEQVSPRFNPYFDFLTNRNIAVYAINYPGSTGIGDAYALRGRSEPESIAIQVPAVERDIAQLRKLHPEISKLTLLGVSYGSILAHLYAAKHPEVKQVVDFSGIAMSNTVPNIGPCNGACPAMLFIYGDNDPFFRDPARRDLIARYEKRAPLSRLVIPDEGHYIERRGAIDQILHRLGDFLAPPAVAANSTAPSD
jgi:alpha/beta superfamily hydrolase